jgi:hypothetical protein
VKHYLFPLSFAFNTFSLSLLVVIAGLTGHPAMAADLSLAQAGMVMFFSSLSGNARNLILKSPDGRIEKSIVQLRLLSAPVLAVAALSVSVSLSKVSLGLALALVIRQVTEWFAEIELSRRERAADHSQAKVFLGMFGLPLLAAALALIFAPLLFVPVLYLWAVLPLLLCLGGIAKYAVTLSTISIEWRKLLPNCGSTFIIGMVVFFFRLLITGFAGKEVAGQLFTAFSLGSIVGSLYERTIGPSFNVSSELSKKRNLISRISWILPVAGLGFVLAAFFLGSGSGYIGRNIYLIAGTGFSLVGGFIVMGAMTIKINLLHSATRDDVFMADLISNFAILLSVPIIYLLFGEAAFVMIFFTNAVLVYIAYWLLSGNPFLQYTPRREKLLHALAAFAVVMPLFIQLGAGIYRGRVELYDWGGRLAMMPLPLSVFLCFPLILLMHSFRGVKTFAVFTFMVFSAMMFGTVVSSPNDPGVIKDKLLLCMQYILPFFGLVLAEHAGDSAFFLKRMARVFFYVVLFIVIGQLGFTLFSGAMRLTPYLYLFSIYGNTQYSTVIFASAFLISFFSLYSVAGASERKWLMFTPALMCLYVALSWSQLAGALMAGGLLLFWVVSKFNTAAGLSCFAGILALALTGAVIRRDSGSQAAITPAPLSATAVTPGDGPSRVSAGVLPAPAVSKVAALLPENLDKRLGIWNFYVRGIKEADTKTLLFGHAGVLHRKDHPSAYNYYIDVLYNFGLLAFFPVMMLVLYTLWLVWMKRRFIIQSPPLLGLAFVVLFLVFVENSFKVGLRQAYPGIYSFFLWGLLISRLWALEPARSVEHLIKTLPDRDEV